MRFIEVFFVIRYIWVMKMECPRCHNQDKRQFACINGRYYCRRCISFHRVFIDENDQEKLFQENMKVKVNYVLPFELSKSQLLISHQLVDNYKHAIHSSVLAVCGSGKTEIVFEVIAYALHQGHRVCFCIPRRELVVELYQRVQEAFCYIDIGIAYGGYLDNIDSQFVICTMHQLYRFENKQFDLMIADEVDAFPFYGNNVLQKIFENCCRRNWIKLSATFDVDDIQDNEKLLVMNRRYHGYDLPVPKCIVCPDWIQKYLLVYLIRYLSKKIIIYVPYIALVDELVCFLNCFHIRSKGVSSLHHHNQDVIDMLKNGQIQVIVSTTLLERGITIEDVQVLVYHCQHRLFDRRTLIQIAGRVGRKPQYPKGSVYFLASFKTKGMKECIKTIKKLNMMNV